jgi:hypothetical protein
MKSETERKMTAFEIFCKSCINVGDTFKYIPNGKKYKVTSTNCIDGFSTRVKVLAIGPDKKEYKFILPAIEYNKNKDLERC